LKITWAGLLRNNPEITLESTQELIGKLSFKDLIEAIGDSMKDGLQK